MSSEKTQQGRCPFYIEKKRKHCCMTVAEDAEFCPHHSFLSSDQRASKDPRIPCPFDPLHYCHLSKLEQHKKKCNARPKIQPEYFRENVNLEEDRTSKKITIDNVSDEELLEVIKKIESTKEVFVPRVSLNPVEFEALMQEKIQSFPFEASEKHFPQQVSLIFLLEKYDLLNSGSCFVEFGAGKGQLMCMMVNSLKERKDKIFVLIDRDAFRYKRDNKLKDTPGLAVERLRIDIKDLYLGGVETVKSYPDKVVGISKHLCGAANDLALRCLMETLKVKKINSDNEQKFTPLGLVMSVCCHHRCSWNSYVGKEFFIENGFSEKNFQILCLMTSWAVCGMRSKKENAQDVQPEQEKELGRYERLCLDHEKRTDIGWKCKRLIDTGRIHYLKKFGMRSELVTYVQDSVSPENVALISVLGS